MTDVSVLAGPFRFKARLETELAPETCGWFLSHMPYSKKLIHVRWSGEGCWIPLGDDKLSFPFENATSYPAAGQFIFYPGGYSQTEILLAYGGVRFASKLGQLAGNHFLTITEGLEQLPELGRLTLWEGAQDIAFTLA
jgi:hypothetical protein